MVSDGCRFTGSSGIRDYVDDAGCLRNVDGEVTLHRGGSGEHWLWDYRRVHFRRTAAIEDDEDFVGLPDDCSRKRSNVAQSYFGRRAKKIRTFFNVNRSSGEGPRDPLQHVLEPSQTHLRAPKPKVLSAVFFWP